MESGRVLSAPSLHRESTDSLIICRIDGRGVIKVADFGLTEDMYGTNYFRRRKSVMGSEEKVPIRWMAIESIENDIYNESTDVVRIYCLIPIAVL